MLRDLLSPSAQRYSAQEISDELEIPMDVLERYTTVGLIAPEIIDGKPMYTLKMVEFIRKHFISTPMAAHWYRQHPKS